MPKVPDVREDAILRHVFKLTTIEKECLSTCFMRIARGETIREQLQFTYPPALLYEDKFYEVTLWPADFLKLDRWYLIQFRENSTINRRYCLIMAVKTTDGREVPLDNFNKIRLLNYKDKEHLK